MGKFSNMSILGKRLFPYALVLPAAVALLMFSVYPLVSAIWNSFTSIGWITDHAHFVGLANYRQILVGNIGTAEMFYDALGHTILWTVVVVAGQFLIGMVVAMVMNERFPGRGLFRTATLAPIAVPFVILALTWRWMYDPYYGIINFYLQKLGLLSGPRMWVGNTSSPLYPLIIVAIWRGFPFMSLMLLSGLQGIPQELYEAAKVDGASGIARLFYITLPQMRTIITIALMLHVLWWWNHFETFMIVGSAGGDYARNAATLPYLAWNEAFRWSHLSLGAAISVMAMVLMVGVIVWNARREARTVSE